MTDGFYGSITKYEKSAFKFDKIYPNRAAMEDNAATDGVFIGRYVLIDYDLEITEGKPMPNDTSNEGSDTPVNENNVVIDGTNSRSIRLLNSTRGGEEDSGETTEEEPSNSQIDSKRFGRSWDSTVWQKVFTIINNEKVFAYRFIADLNAANPVVEVWPAPASADIFTIPQESDSNKFTIQIPDNWDFMGGEITIPGKQLEGIEDGNVFNGEYSYNQNDNIDNLELTEVLNNIPYHRYFVKNEDTQEIEEYVKPANPNPDITKDTKQMLMNLPSITTAVSNMWDSVYGKPSGENTYIKRNTDTEWDSYDGIRALEEVNGNISFNKENLKTLAGTINSAHDLMGMIIDTSKSDLNDVESWDASKIYYVNNKFYTKYKKYIQYNSQPSVIPVGSLEDVYTLEKASENGLLNFRVRIFDINFNENDSTYSFKIGLEVANISEQSAIRIPPAGKLKLSQGGSDSIYSQARAFYVFRNVLNVDGIWSTIPITSDITASLSSGNSIFVSYINGNFCPTPITPDTPYAFEISYNMIRDGLVVNNIENDIEELYIKITPTLNSSEKEKYIKLNDWNNYIPGQKLYIQKNIFHENSLTTTYEEYADDEETFIPYKFYEDYECSQPIIDYSTINNLEKVYLPSTPLFQWEAKELINFGRDFSTLHGMLLRLFSLLPDRNADNRDLTTIQGCLNLLKQSSQKITDFYSILTDFQENMVQPNLEKLENQFNTRFSSENNPDIFDINNNNEIIQKNPENNWTWAEQIAGLIYLVQTNIQGQISGLNDAIAALDNAIAEFNGVKPHLTFEVIEDSAEEQDGGILKISLAGDENNEESSSGNNSGNNFEEDLTPAESGIPGDDTGGGSTDETI